MFQWMFLSSCSFAMNPHLTASRVRRFPVAAVMNESPVEGAGIAPALNVIGTQLECCCADVHGSGIGTGFYRDGHCSTGPQDTGRHTVCVVATKEFLSYSASVGNDLSTPIPAYNFPGVLPGDCWCLCASRWVQALQAGRAPRLKLLATHANTLNLVKPEERDAFLSVLKLHAIDVVEAEAALASLNEKRRALEKLV